jgi:hypothetical protein
VATLVTVGTLLTGALGLSAAFAVGAAAAAGSSMAEISKTVADFLSAGLNFDRKQRDTMTKHPMAYMYALSSIH